MRKNQKKLSLSLAFFALAGLMISFTPNQVYADPAPDGYEKVWQFNMIARPNDFKGNCGNGDRLFVNPEENKHAHVDIINSNFWDVTDCNATGGNHGEVTFDGTGTYKVAVITMGQPGTSFRICTSDDKSSHDDSLPFDDDEHLCIIDEVIVREKGKPKIRFDLQGLFDPALVDEIWSVGPDGQAKIRFVVYKALPV